MTARHTVIHGGLAERQGTATPHRGKSGAGSSPAAAANASNSDQGGSTAIRARAAGMEGPASAGVPSTVPAGSATHHSEAAAPDDRPLGNPPARAPREGGTLPLFEVAS